MATAIELAKLPFTALWMLVKLLFLPVLITFGAWLVLDSASPWFVGIALVCGLWALALVRLWGLKLRGTLRSLGRGTVRIKASRSRRGGRR